LLAEMDAISFANSVRSRPDRPATESIEIDLGRRRAADLGTRQV